MENNNNNNKLQNFKKDDILYKSIFNLKDSKIFDDKYLNNEIIEKYYGVYPLYGSKDDILISRFQWIENSIDNGFLYYRIVIKDLIQLNIDKLKVSNIDNNIKSIEKEISILQKNSNINNLNNLNKLEHINYIFSENIKVDTNTITKIEYNNIIQETFEKGNNKIISDTNKYEACSLSVLNIINIIDKDFPIIEKRYFYKWIDNKWKLIENEPLYENIKYMCNFNNINLSNIGPTKLGCIYNDIYGCNSKKILRTNKKLKLLNEYLESYKDSKQFYSNNHIKLIDDEIKNSEKKLKKFIIKYNSNNENKTTIENTQNIEIIPKSKINKLINKINSLYNDDKKKELFNLIIDLDGLLIDDYIYSKKFSESIICGHWLYIRKLLYATTNSEKELINTEMLSTYGDEGLAINGSQSCRVCSAILDSVSYDSVDTFKIGILREEWEEDDDILYKESYNIIAKEEIMVESICSSDKFKKKLKEYGYIGKDINDSIIICDIIVNISTKLGYILKREMIETVIIDSMNEIKNIPSYDKELSKMKKKHMNEGRDNSQIEKLDEKGYYSDLFDRLQNMNYYSIIGSRLLILLQTNIPKLERKGLNSTNCVFTNLNDLNGLRLIVCILIDMDFFKNITKIKKSDLEKEVLINLEKNYNKFKNKKYISKLFNDRFLYDKKINILSESKEFVFKDYTVKNITYTSEEIPTDYINKIKNKTQNQTNANIQNNKKNYYKNIAIIADKIIKKQMKLLKIVYH